MYNGRKFICTLLAERTLGLIETDQVKIDNYLFHVLVPAGILPRFVLDTTVV